jgi:DNA-binding transcriptional LysR family regulator
MRITELSAFVRCAELGGLSAAARTEQRPKSTLSRSLRGLERDLKVRLFERSARGVVLTDEGRAFLPHAREVLESIERATAAAGFFKSGPVGDVRITAPYTFGVTFIAPLLPAFLNANPGLNVHMELTSRNVGLAEEGFDLAVRIGAVPPGLVAHRLARNRKRRVYHPARGTEDAGRPGSPSAVVDRKPTDHGGAQTHQRGVALGRVGAPPIDVLGSSGDSAGGRRRQRHR